MFFDIVIAALAGPLLIAGAAKLFTPPRKLDWPFKSGVLRPPWGPRLTGATETTAAVAIVAAPGRLAALIALLAYLALTVVAYALRGERCACFGLARLASVGRVHIGANAIAALAAVVALVAGPGSELIVRAAAGVGAAVVTLATALILDRRREQVRDTGAAPCGQQVTAVRLYVTDGCPSCRSLKQLLETVEPARREAVTTTVVERGEKLPGPLSELGVPCALGVDASGEPVCSPAEGIGAVKALIDGITVRSREGARVG